MKLNGVGLIFVLSTVMVLSISIVSAQQPMGTFESNTFSVSNMTAIKEEGFVYAQDWNILGNIKNVSNKTIDNIQLVADIYDPSNQLIDVVTGSPSFGKLPPDEDSSFKLEYQTDNNSTVFDHYIIRIGEGSNEFGKFLGLLGNLTNLNK